MRDDGDGRFCERCQLRVTEVAKLDDHGLEQLIAAAERGRVCGRFELEDGRVRTKLGLAAGLLVALSGCATTSKTVPHDYETYTPIQPTSLRGGVTGAVAIDNTVHFDSGFVSAGLRIGE